MLNSISKPSLNACLVPSLASESISLNPGPLGSLKYSTSCYLSCYDDDDFHAHGCLLEVVSPSKALKKMQVMIFL